MPRHIIFYILALIGLLIGGQVCAAEQKIGFVNTARLLKAAPQAEAARKKLENEFAPRDQKIVKMHKKSEKNRR